MFRHKIYYRCRLRPIKQTVTAADELNLAYALRQRKIVKSRKTNPITHERQAVPKHQSKLGFLWITQPPIAEIELPRRVLLRNQETRCLGEEFLLIVVLHRRLLVELDDGCLFCDRDFRVPTLPA